MQQHTNNDNSNGPNNRRDPGPVPIVPTSGSFSEIPLIGGAQSGDNNDSGCKTFSNYLSFKLISVRPFFTRLRSTFQRYVSDRVFIEYHFLFHPFILATDPRLNKNNQLVVTGQRIVLAELFFLIHLVSRDYRDIFILNYVGSPYFYQNFAVGTPLHHQWAPCDAECLNGMVDWLRLNVARIGGPALRLQMAHQMWTSEVECQNVINSQLDIERTRNPHLVNAWLNANSSTPFKSQPSDSGIALALPRPEFQPKALTAPVKPDKADDPALATPIKPQIDEEPSLPLNDNPNATNMSV